MPGDQDWRLGHERAQADTGSEPYDGWFTPDGECTAEFFRLDRSFLVRHPGEADFEIAIDDHAVQGFPAPGMPLERVQKLYNNCIVPLLGNHRGGLFLHGSAVQIGDQAAAFLGLSRSGKTTLAGGFAKQGYPFLTEDVIDLDTRSDGYWLRPKPSSLRLFQDSAEHLLDRPVDCEDEGEKFDLAAGDVLPFSEETIRLSRIFVLGTDHSAPLSITPFGAQEALTALLPHSFILDVEDKRRLRSHFGRLADLSETTPCYALDYPRQYSELPGVIEEILANLR